MSESFLWHDYETWGADPQRDRPCQFACVRTDFELNEIASPQAFYCRPPTDLLPQPGACLTTGITPQQALREGLVEAEFAARIVTILSRPRTCAVGYNSMRFDDEVTRHLLYRNLFDPYAREWRHGNSRWDLIDVLRMAHALRPQGIVWPQREDGSASFRLEALTAANGIEHGSAHEALADVRATIALARLLRRVQPRLFDYALRLRTKATVRGLLDGRQPVLHVSARYRAEYGCIAAVQPLAEHPGNPNGVICFDLRADPEQLLTSPVETLRERVFSPSTALAAAGQTRIPLKTVHLNRAPMLAPLSTLSAEAASRWDIDPQAVQTRAAFIRAQAGAFRERARAVFQPPEHAEPPTDPDLMLYSGGFFSDADRRVLDALQALPPETLRAAPATFEDSRLARMLWRYRARNWPETLDEDECEEWAAERLWRLTDPAGGASVQIDDYMRELAELRQRFAAKPDKIAILDALEIWGAQLMDAAP